MEAPLTCSELIQPPRTGTLRTLSSMSTNSSESGGGDLGQWGTTITQLEDSGGNGAVLSATSKALKAALFENEELRNLNTDLESRLLAKASGLGEENVRVEEIENALSVASAALARQRGEIAEMEQTLLQAEWARDEAVEKNRVLQHALDGIPLARDDRGALIGMQREVERLLEDGRIRQEEIDRLIAEKQALQASVDSLRKQTHHPLPGAGEDSLETIQESAASSVDATPEASPPPGASHSPVEGQAGMAQAYERIAELESALRAKEREAREGREAQVEAQQHRERAQQLSAAHEEMRKKLALTTGSFEESVREACALKSDLEQANFKLAEAAAKLRIYSSFPEESKHQPQDERVAQERSMMQDALDRMRAHMYEALEAQRRDAGRELRMLREEMTQEVLKMQVAKERAEAQLRATRSDGSTPSSAGGSVEGGAVRGGSSSAEEEIVVLREELRKARQQQQALADFWALEKRRFEGMDGPPPDVAALPPGLQQGAPSAVAFQPSPRNATWSTGQPVPSSLAYSSHRDQPQASVTRPVPSTSPSAHIAAAAAPLTLNPAYTAQPGAVNLNPPGPGASGMPVTVPSHVTVSSVVVQGVAVSGVGPAPMSQWVQGPRAVPVATPGAVSTYAGTGVGTGRTASDWQM